MPSRTPKRLSGTGASRMWDEDFSYEYYGKLLDCITDRFDILLVREADLPIDGNNLAFIRHDIDVDLNKALEIAKIEHGKGISSTFYIRVSAPNYDINTPESGSAVSMILSLGHDIGLHYDSYNDTGIKEATGVLEGITGCTVDTISSHIPQQRDINGAFRINGLINAYSKELMQWYISDSSGRWRCGDPIKHIEKHEKTSLQILTHPVWWGRRKLNTRERDKIVSALRNGKI